MGKILRCSSVMPGCPAEIRGDDPDEMLRQAAEHARTAHGVEKVDEATAQKLRAAIADQP